eukprot:PLAT15180.1.p1 GENE.PLAT15180.1~~PLAT15180.1.p1  ORF type:complete len:373 (+),score=129.41 PLAT15180.1:1-1119(+)
MEEGKVAAADGRILVADCGSQTVRAGWAGDRLPTALRAAPDSKSVKWPQTEALCRDWAALAEALADMVTNDLGAGEGGLASTAGLLITEPPLRRDADRIAAAEALFEAGGAPALHFHAAQVLSLYAASRTTGLVADIGSSGSWIAPVAEGQLQWSAVQFFPVGGAALEASLGRLLEKRGIALTADVPSDRALLRHMLQLTGYVAVFPDAEERTFSRDRALHYEMPDGTVVTVKEERFLAPELLFQPQLAGGEAPGLHGAVDAAITNCSLDLRSSLRSNIVLAGGCSQLPGLSKRLTRECLALAPTGADVSVSSPSNAAYSAWLGGSILSSLESFNDMLITAADWAEAGERLVCHPALSSSPAAAVTEEDGVV